MNHSPAIGCAAANIAYVLLRISIFTFPWNENCIPLVTPFSRCFVWFIIKISLSVVFVAGDEQWISMMVTVNRCIDEMVHEHWDIRCSNRGYVGVLIYLVDLLIIRSSPHSVVMMGSTYQRTARLVVLKTLRRNETRNLIFVYYDLKLEILKS